MSRSAAPVDRWPDRPLLLACPPWCRRDHEEPEHPGDRHWISHDASVVVDGTRAWVEVPVYDDGRRPMTVVGLDGDVTSLSATQARTVAAALLAAADRADELEGWSPLPEGQPPHDR